MFGSVTRIDDGVAEVPVDVTVGSRTARSRPVESPQNDESSISGQIHGDHSALRDDNEKSNATLVVGGSCISSGGIVSVEGVGT